MPRRVYVIELAPGAGRRRDPRIPWVYVGSSAREPEIRFEQHRRGYRSAGIVKRHALRLRPDLYEDLEPIRGSRAVVEAERARAVELAGAGFIAHCDGVSYGRRGEPGSGAWEEWGAERLAPVADHLDAAIGELSECSFRPLDAGRCAALLHGTRAFWVAEHLDPLDPPPAWGRFAHVRLELLEARAAELLTASALIPDGGCVEPHKVGQV
jgi:hypothetical protein